MAGGRIIRLPKDITGITMESHEQAPKNFTKKLFKRGCKRPTFEMKHYKHIARENEKRSNENLQWRFGKAAEATDESAGKKTTEKKSVEDSQKWFLDWLKASENLPSPKLKRLSPNGPHKSIMKKKTIIDIEDMRLLLTRKPVAAVDIVRTFAPKIRKTYALSDGALLLDMWVVIKKLNPYVQNIADKNYYSLLEEPEM